MGGSRCDGSRSRSHHVGDPTPAGCSDPFRVCLSGPPSREPEDLLAEDLEPDNRVDIPVARADVREIQTGIVVKFNKFGQHWEFELVERSDDELLEPFSMEWLEAAIVSAWEEAEKLYVESRDGTT
jgi:hypothetical protein